MKMNKLEYSVYQTICTSPHAQQRSSTFNYKLFYMCLYTLVIFTNFFVF